MESSNTGLQICPKCKSKITLRMTSSNSMDDLEPGYQKVCSNMDCNWEGDWIE